MVSFIAIFLISFSQQALCGEKVYREGDMLKIRIGGGDNMVNTRAAIFKKADFWPNGRIPYVIDPNYDNRERDMIKKAMNEYHGRTCIRFEPKKSTDKTFISIKKEKDGCFAYVGMLGHASAPNGQTVNLKGDTCFPKSGHYGAIVHELMHAVGFEHEQNRIDRDNYIILSPRISKGMKEQFVKANPKDRKDVLQYDYNSAMHYLQSFHRGPDGKSEPDFVAKPPHVVTKWGRDGQTDVFSPLDVRKINTLYNCGSRG
jgi:hypothetical protein